jgi:hypothetical protein
MTDKDGKSAEQKHAEKIIVKHGGEKMKDGRWDMTKGVEKEKGK